MHDLRSKIRQAHVMPEKLALDQLIQSADLDGTTRQRITNRAIEIVRQIRDASDPGMIELFLGEYGLSSNEGIALMCLAEALLRVPDSSTIDALIDDKIAPSAWGRHLGKSHSSLINATTWALFVTGRVLDDDDDNSIASTLHGAIKRLGEPVIRQAVTRIMKELGGQFVLGETIEAAMDRARGKEQEGFTYSYDILGEAAHTERDAKRYHLAYSDAIAQLAESANSSDIRENPGISIKLSALHPRYETLQRQRVMDELVPQARSLAILAKSADIGLNIDAEEAGRLDLSLDIIEAILADPVLKDWQGFGVVVQAYSLRAPYVLDWLYDLAGRLDRSIMVRLVKGAYWDTEIKLAQVEGLEGFPVFTQKPSTDVSYICCARKLLNMTDQIYPQFATHNAHTVSAILELAIDKTRFEFQRLHGMGEALHDNILKNEGTRCRIYAPVGAHRELLAYLVRRLLENGANSSFVNQIVDETIAPEEVAADPFALVAAYRDDPTNPRIRRPIELFSPQRRNSKGFDLQDPTVLEQLQQALAERDTNQWHFSLGSGTVQSVVNPANGDPVGAVTFCTAEDVARAANRVRGWNHTSVQDRAEILRKAADLFEENAMDLFSLLMREAGKTLLDCVGEVREAVDFLRYYAALAAESDDEPAGIFTCISPWNFPLAIFSGQISAALATGNGVLAKPAEATSLIAHYAVSLLHQAGIPEEVLILLPGTGGEVGTSTTANPVVDGVCFTGSTHTAQLINRNMAQHLAPHAPLIAETGGLNAMIVDSTALPEQAITDIVASAFQSAGQRCSALRVLYLQEDIVKPFLQMLYGAMDELCVGEPRDFQSDIGPVIDGTARKKIADHIKQAEKSGRLLKQIAAPETGTYVGPAVISVTGIEQLEEEIFGPVLHVATFKNSQFDQVLDAVNRKGFGLTFGLHSRIDERVQMVIDQVDAGNIYINRNQIGAVVGSQPFGGEGLSGTGPKAGGPRYLNRFYRQRLKTTPDAAGNPVTAQQLTIAFDQAESVRIHGDAKELPGPTGESNRYFLVPKDRVLCLGPGDANAEAQASRSRSLGCNALAVTPGCKGGIDGNVTHETLAQLNNLDAVICWSQSPQDIRLALADRNGRIVPLLCDESFDQWLVLERHACIDTTAAGGNVALLGGG